MDNINFVKCGLIGGTKKRRKEKGLSGLGLIALEKGLGWDGGWGAQEEEEKDEEKDFFLKLND